MVLLEIYYPVLNYRSTPARLGLLVTQVPGNSGHLNVEFCLSGLLNRAFEVAETQYGHERAFKPCTRHALG